MGNRRAELAFDLLCLGLRINHNCSSSSESSVMATHAPTHTIPVCLFELHGGHKDSSATPHDAAQELAGAPDYRAKHKNTKERPAGSWKTRASSQRPANRFGPGRLSQRRRQTERLRELRMRRSASEPAEVARAIPLSRESHEIRANGVRQDVRKSGSDQHKMCHPRATSSREACQQITLGPLSGKSKDDIGPRTGALLPVENTPRIISTKLMEDNRARVTGDFIGWGNDDSELNPWSSTGRNTRQRKHEGLLGSSKSIVLDTTDQATSLGIVREVATRQSDDSSPGAGGRIYRPATVSAAVLPIRSSPCSLRSSRGTSQGSKRSFHTGKEHAQSTNGPRGNEKVCGVAEATGLVRSQDGESSVDIHTHGTVNDTGAFLTQAGALIHPGLGMPDVADACSGVILRLCPSERSLDPWDTLVAPVRAMCAIEPSLSRAGMEYRGTISAVGEAQEIKAKDQTKRKFARDAKSLLGRDVRPRTSEARLHTAGIAAELDVMKAIIVRERLVVTLRRLTQRLRRRCHNLESCLRREFVFRLRYATDLPDVVICATNVARRTLNMEQHELRVVLAHLRAISFDTVKAITTWRATFVVSEKPTYRQLRPTGSSHSENVTNHSDASLESPQDAAVANIAEDVSSFQDKNERQPSHVTHHDKELPVGKASHRIHAGDTSEAGNALSWGNTSTMAKSDSTIAAFYWKGRNYMVKMAHDLEFLDDSTVSNPVSTWLGFTVHNNPFLIPPEGLDVCETLRREHEERHEAASSRRSHRRRGSNSRRRSSSRANRDTGFSDFFLHQSRRSNGDGGRGMETGVSQTKHDQQPTLFAASLGEEGAMTAAMESRGDSSFAGAANRVTDAYRARSASASASVSVDHRRVRGLEAIDAEMEMLGELSSGEEEEIRWGGGSHLDAPIIPPVPNPVRVSASVAEGLLRRELASERALENHARVVLGNARRAREIIDEPRKEVSSRVDSLAQKSFSEDLRGSLKDRSVSVARLRATSGVEMAVSERISSRRVFTAPAGGSGSGSGSGRHISGVGVSARGSAGGRGWTACLGRGGVRTSADGWTPEGARAETATKASRTGSIPAGRRKTTGGNHPSSTDRKHSFESSTAPLTPHRSRNSGGWIPLPSRRPATASYAANNSIGRGEVSSVLSPERTAERSTERSADGTESPSLQASLSSMSDRARIRARAHRPTATRRGRKTGKLIVVDPATSKKTRKKSALLIQAAFFRARARSTARRLREKRAWAATTICRVWRGWRVRVVMWTMNWVARAERLKRRVEDRVRSRAAHLITIFFRDIVYRKRRDRRALFIRDRERITREIQEQVAAIVIQGNIRRFQAYVRVKSKRLNRRHQAQVRIARAARERMAHLRRTELDSRQREEEAMERRAKMKKRATQEPDEAATRIQAWLRGVHGRRMMESLRTAARKHVSTASSPSLQAALGALDDARSVALGSGRDSRRRLAEKNPRRTDDVVGTPDEPTSPSRGAVRWKARVEQRRNTPSRGRQRHKPMA